MNLYKTGRLPATRPAVLKDLAVYATGPLPTPPPTISVPNTPYPIDGNATYGDCTIAGVAHTIAALNRLLGEKDKVPNEKEVVAEYFKLTGGQDTGLNESEVLKTWLRSGLFGEKIAGYAPVNPKDLLQLHQAVAFYGGCYLGIACPESAQRQFQEGAPWTYEGEETEDGHCVVALGYGPNGGLHVATWGGIAVLEASFLAHYLEEAWVVLSHQLVEHKGDSLGLALPQLQADLKLV
jgi:hypothetical protein